MRALSFCIVMMVSSPVLAEPGFDCAKVATSAERLICKNDALGQKDVELTVIYKDVRSIAGRKRGQIAAGQTEWLAERDRRCADGAESEQIGCLSKLYEQRIAELKPQRPGAAESLAICHRMLDAYTSLLKADPQAPYKKEWQAAGMVDLLAATPGSGLEVAPQLRELRSLTQTGAPDAESYVTKTFRADAGLRAALAETGEQTESALAVWLSRLPHSDLYGLSSMSGSMRCETTELFFKTSPKSASLAASPTAGSEGDCAYSRFGAFENKPVLIVGDFRGQSTPRTYNLTEGFTLHPWRDGWRPACNVSLTYAPRMSYSGRADMKEPITDGDGAVGSCPAGDTGCGALREAVLAVMVRYQQDPAAMPRALVGELDGARRAAFLALKDLFDRLAAKGGDVDTDTPAGYASMPLDPPADLDVIPLYNKPVALPLVHDGETLVVLAGHGLTTGSRDLPDYLVSVVRSEGGSAVAIANFTVALTTGTVEKVVVSWP